MQPTNLPGRHRIARAGLAFAMTMALALALAACSSGSTAAPSAAASAPAATSGPATGGTAVTIANFAFGPESLTIAVGDSVTWTNQDSAGHTVTADDGSFKSGTLATGDTFSQTFSAAGTYAYHCAIHPKMKATIVVQ